MTKKNLNKAALLLSILFSTSCNTYYYVNGESDIVYKNVVSKADAFRNYKKSEAVFLIRKIIWSKKCNCGLVDITQRVRDNYNYYPVLIDSNNVYNFKYDTNLSSNTNKKILDDFFRLKKSSFDESDRKLAYSRMEKGIVHFGSSLLSNTLDIVSDSTLFKKYFPSETTTVKISY